MVLSICLVVDGSIKLGFKYTYVYLSYKHSCCTPVACAIFIAEVEIQYYFNHILVNDLLSITGVLVYSMLQKY